MAEFKDQVSATLSAAVGACNGDRKQTFSVLVGAIAQFAAESRDPDAVIAAVIAAVETLIRAARRARREGFAADDKGGLEKALLLEIVAS